MELRDKRRWRDFVAENEIGYGSSVIRFATRWANLMEERLGEGKTVAEVAEPTSHEANTDGITRYVYGCAVAILAEVWQHGEELRNWHNIKHQMHDEGSKANKSGGVLNPSVLRRG